MRSAKITGAGKPLKITSHPLPKVPAEGVLLKTLCGGICHSDIHFIDDITDLGGGKIFKHRDILGENFTGVIPGHEIVGIVTERGHKVPLDHPIKVGDTVMVYPWMGCRKCEVCLAMNSNLCENNNGTTTDIGQGENSGGYGSYVPVPDIGLCVRLPKNVRPEIGCMLPCSGLTAYSSLQKARPALDAAVRIRGVANLLLIGVGGLGMWAVVLAKSVFCNQNVKVLCADLNEEKLGIASKLGADDTIKWAAEADINSLVDATTVHGYNKIDAAINFVGSTKTVQVAFESLHHGGTTVLVGLYGGEYQLSLPLIISRSISIQGMRVAGISTLKELVDVLAVQDLQKYPDIEIIDLDQVNETIDRLKRGELQGRAIIKHSD